MGLTQAGRFLFLYETPQLFAYFPLAQHYGASATLMVYSQDDPLRLVGPVRDQVQQLDGSLPVFDVNTMEAHVEYGKPLLPARLGAMLVGAFGMLGLVLAPVGVYGVVSYSVSQRTHEIGIRSALGAQRRNVLGMVLKQGMTMALIGMAIGIVLAFFYSAACTPFSTALLRRIWSRSRQFPVCCLPLWPAIFRRCAPRKWIPWLRFANNNILLSVVTELRPR